MKLHQHLFFRPIPLALLVAVLITTNPFNFPPEPKAFAEIKIKQDIPQPIIPLVPVIHLVERTPEASKEYARTQLAKFGWDTESQWQCLLAVWIHESNWRPDAYNRTAIWQNGERVHAGGIPQMLGLDPASSVEEQVAMGLNYFRYRYGSPCIGLRFWERNFWY